MPDLGNDIPQPFSVRRRGREWEVVVLPLLPQAKPTLVAESPNESVAETIAEECNAGCRRLLQGSHCSGETVASHAKGKSRAGVEGLAKG